MIRTFKDINILKELVKYEQSIYVRSVTKDYIIYFNNKALKVNTLQFTKISDQLSFIYNLKLIFLILIIILLKYLKYSGMY